MRPNAPIQICVLVVAPLATAAWASPTARPRPCEAAAVELFGHTPPTLGKEVPEPKKTRHVSFEFPRRKLPLKGKNIFVWVGEVLIDPEGEVRDVFVTRDFGFEPPWPEFSAAVPKAIRRWRYTPTVVRGTAMPVCMPVSVNVHW
jgi:hypothetical protein